jgi:nitrogen regulatory protein P-II 2
MQLYPLKLVSVVGESVIMEDIAEEAVKLGASGYSLTDVHGQGSRSTRNVIITTGAKTMKAEFVVPMNVAERILTHVSHNYFEHYACIAWLSDVQVVRGQTYVTE